MQLYFEDESIVSSSLTETAVLNLELTDQQQNEFRSNFFTSRIYETLV